ncbi:hypothetical protein [Methanosarcina sp. DH2]|uniref:hypothetical protein n=1 Tax=Methanosarcina sp. DH2 TaxID=2605639 RepID=UPI001E58E473|nr:hypothetical protein [Methanosarcina sp. DH2]
MVFSYDSMVTDRQSAGVVSDRCLTIGRSGRRADGFAIYREINLFVRQWHIGTTIVVGQRGCIIDRGLFKKCTGWFVDNKHRFNWITWLIRLSNLEVNDYAFTRLQSLAQSALFSLNFEVVASGGTGSYSFHLCSERHNLPSVLFIHIGGRRRARCRTKCYVKVRGTTFVLDGESGSQRKRCCRPSRAFYQFKSKHKCNIAPGSNRIDYLEVAGLTGKFGLRLYISRNIINSVCCGWYNQQNPQ